MCNLIQANLSQSEKKVTFSISVQMKALISESIGDYDTMN